MKYRAGTMYVSIWTARGMERIGKMKPDRNKAGSIDAKTPIWKAIAWLSAMLLSLT